MHRCGPIQRGADRLKIQNPPMRRMYLRVSADPSETTASHHFNLSLHIPLSVSWREFFQSPSPKLAWVVGYHFRLRDRHFDSFAQVVDSRASRKQRMVREWAVRLRMGYSGASTWIAAPAPILQKMQATLSKNVGIILSIDAQKCRQYILRHCKNVGSILSIDAQKCRHYFLHQCTKM